jgi:hypothetical protein
MGYELSQKTIDLNRSIGYGALSVGNPFAAFVGAASAG